MDITLVKSLYRETEKHMDKEVKINGWVRTVRDSKNFAFVEVNDGSFFKNVQVILESSLENFKELCKMPISTSVEVEGIVQPTPNAKQPFEIKATRISIEGKSSTDYPLQKKRHTFEYLRTIAHLRPRSNAFSAVFRVRSLAAYAVHKFSKKEDLFIQTPQ